MRKVLLLVLFLAVLAFLGSAASSIEESPLPSTSFDESEGAFVEYNPEMSAVEQDASAEEGLDLDADLDADSESDGNNDETAEGPVENQQEDEQQGAEEQQQNDADVMPLEAHNDDPNFTGIQNKYILKKISNGFKKAGSALKKGAQWAGKKVWGGIQKVGEAAYNGLKNGVKKAFAPKAPKAPARNLVEERFTSLEKRIAEMGARDQAANSATDKKVDKALNKLRRLHRTMQELRRLMTQIKTHVVSLLPAATAQRYLKADRSTISNSQLSKTLIDKEDTLKDPWHPMKNAGAEYNDQVIPSTTPEVDEQDDDGAQELATEQRNVSEESRTMARKDDISLV